MRLKLDHAQSRETAQSFFLPARFCLFFWQQLVFTNCFGISEAQVFDPRVLAEFDCLHDSNSITRKPAGSRHLPRKKQKKPTPFSTVRWDLQRSFYAAKVSLICKLLHLFFPGRK